MRLMKRKSLLVMFLAGLTLGVGAADDINEVATAVAANPAPAPDAPMRLKAAKAMSLQAAEADSGFKDYVYDATGELNVTKGEGTISLNFAVDRHFTEIESAKVVFSAYDVDYPADSEDSEQDVAYFNDKAYVRLQGGNNAWHQNAFSISDPMESIRLPKVTGERADNSFYVEVDIADGDWVTSIGWARLEIRGKEGIVLKASDGTEPDCVKLEWEGMSVGDTYTVYRDGEVIASGVSGTTYEDRDVKWGKPYTYHVEGRKGGQSNDDEGLVGLLPMVTDVEVAELWLTKEGPYNVRLTWNNFDPEKVRVNNVKFTIEREQSPTFGFDYEINARTAMSAELVPRDFDLTKDGKFVIAEMHGKYTVRVTWDAYVVKSGKVVTDQDANYKGDPMKVENVEARVFFNKYVRDSDDIPNWYRYWIDDGAVVADKIAMDRKNDADDAFDGYFHFGDDLGANTLGECKSRQMTRHVNQTPLGFPPICLPEVAGGNVAIRYRVSDLAAASKSPCEAGRRGSVGAQAIGIHCFACIIAHERKHGEFFHAENDLTKYRIGQRKKRFLLFPTLQVVQQHLIWAGYDREDSQYHDYYKDVVECLSGRQPVFCDLDGDSLDDYTEGSMGFSYDTPNTYEWNKEEYLSYADNEILAREAEKSPAETHPENDWAFPGENCEGSKTFIGYDKEAWESRRESVANRLQRIGGGAFAFAQSVKSQSFSSKASLMAAGSVACSRTESVSAFPDFTSETNGDLFQFKSAVLEPVVSGGGKYAALNVRIPVTYSGADGKSFLFTGYLTDDSGSPAVRVSEQRALSPGENEVLLVVDGQRLYASGLPGYSLRYVTVVGADDEFASVVGFGENLGTTMRTIASNEFTPPEAMLGPVEFIGRGPIGQLLADCIVRLSESGTYKLVASLKTKEGKSVASAVTDGIKGPGEIKVRLSFAARDIYLSGHDGPYVIGSAWLMKDTEQVADKSVFGESEAYSYVDFADGESVLFANENDLACEIGNADDDGLVDSLSFALPLRNKSPVVIPASVRTYLRNTNGVFVVGTTEHVRLVPGDNMVKAMFSGDTTRQKGVGGPYILQEVRVVPDSESYCLLRVFPKMEPIDLNPEDFGAYPFELQGDPAVTTGSGAAAYSVSVPLKILRANKVTVTALMVDAEGRYVATATKSAQYDAPGSTVMSISFSEEDIQASGRRGPYTIRYLRVESDLQGVAPLRVTSFRSEQIERQYQLYVDAARPDDSGDGLTPATAKRTIQAAVDRAKDGDVVVVANGTYEPFDADNKRIEIVSRFGYQYTIVDGGSVRRCATLGHEESQTNTVLRGFTLKNGDTTGDELVLWNCGGGVCGGTVQNCHITGCHASKGGGAYYGRLENCLIEDNEADTYGGGSYYGTRVNCTIVGNRASYSGGGTYYGTSVNSIVWANSYGRYTLYEGNWHDGSFDHCVTTPCPVGNGNRAADPGFTKPDVGDYTLANNSVCLDAGDADAVVTETDLAGNPRLAGIGVDIGAFELPRNPFVYGQADFVRSVLEVSEGDTATLEVWGGLENVASSVYLYLPSADGTTKDVDLTKVRVDGKTVENAKFPLKLTWAAGELSARKVSIPVKVDSSVEGGEVLYFQLGKASGMSLGTYRLCQVVVKDKSVPSVSLATAANSTGLKVTTSGSGKWKAANGNAFYVSGEDRGGYHLVTPKLAKGKQAKLTFGGVKGKGNMVVMFRFTGDTAEWTSSTLKIYAGKKLMRTYYHSSTGNGWQRYTIEDSTTSSHTYSYVFTQGSDSGAHVELVGSYFLPKGKCTPFMVYVTTMNSNYGSVTGMGFYRSGQTVKISAKANPGHVFKGWYKWSNAEGKYMYWTKTAKKSFAAAANLDIAAMFAPYATVTPLSWQPERGTVSGGGACAPDKKVTLKAKAKSGYVFAGWYLNGNRVSLSATYKAPCPSGNVIYYAYFVTASEDKKSVVASVGGQSFAAGGATPVTKAAQTITCGVTVKWPVASSALSSTTVKVTGLPTGLKYDTKKKAIVGVPTKTGTKTATVAVTTAGKSTVKFSLIVKVNPLPSWAKGNFEGIGDADGKPRRVTFTVSSVGKLSGTVAFAGETWKLAVSSYAAEYDGWFEANVKATKGKSSKSVRVIVYKSEHGGFAYGETPGFEFDAEQNRWTSDATLKSLAVQFKGQVIKVGDDLTVSIGKAGAVTAKLKTKQGTFSASATLLPVYGEDGLPSRYLVGLRFAPNTTKKFKGAVRLVELE